VDTDQYETVLQLPYGAAKTRAWQSHILTSVLKGIDAQIYAAVADYGRRQFKPGLWKWGLESGALGLSYSGGYLDDIRANIDALKRRIIDHEILVPCIPKEKAQEAVDLGIPPGQCHPPMT